MALLFADSFDDGLQGLKWATYGGSVSPGRTGSGGMRLDWNGQVFSRKVLNNTITSPIIVGFAYRPNGSITHDFMNIGLGIVPFVNTGAPHFYMRVTNNQGLSVGRGGMYGVAAGQTALGTTANNIITVGGWNYIEIKLVVHASAGAITVRLNGAEVLALTNVNTQIGGSAGIDTIAFAESFAGTYQDFDDLYVCDGTGTVNNDFLGDINVVALLPAGNGALSQLVGSDGNQTDNYLLVDEASPSTADYVEGGVTGLIDTYVFADVNPGTIKGVIVQPYVAKTDSGARSARTITRLTGANYVGAETVLSTSYTVLTTTHENNPATGLPWTVGEVNGAEFGLEVR